MTARTSSRRRLQALERRHRERGPCPSCPPLVALYQEDDGKLSQEGGQAAPPGPAACPACGHPARAIVMMEVDDWWGSS